MPALARRPLVRFGFFTHLVLAIGLDGSLETIARVPAQPAGLGFLPDGRVLVVAMRDRTVLCRKTDGSLDLHADLSALAPGFLNDMLVDGDGRGWVGNFGFDLYAGEPPRNTVLICVEPDGSAHVAAQDLCFPNGTVLTPDGKTMIVAETTANRLSAFSVSGGQLGQRRTWAKFGEPPTAADLSGTMGQIIVGADGICLDAEGAVWIADALHSRLLRVAEGGRILEELPVNGLGVFACMLGGEDGKTLFVCAAPSFHEEECLAKRAACILTTRVEAPRAGWP